MNKHQLEQPYFFNLPKRKEDPMPLGIKVAAIIAAIIATAAVASFGFSMMSKPDDASLVVGLIIILIILATIITVVQYAYRRVVAKRTNSAKKRGD